MPVVEFSVGLSVTRTIPSIDASQDAHSMRAAVENLNTAAASPRRGLRGPLPTSAARARSNEAGAITLRKGSFVQIDFETELPVLFEAGGQSALPKGDSCPGFPNNLSTIVISQPIVKRMNVVFSAPCDWTSIDALRVSNALRCDVFHSSRYL